MDDYDFSADDDRFGGSIPASFGKQNTTVNVEKQIEQCRRAVVEEGKTPAIKNKKESDDEDSDDDSDSDDEDEDEFPVSHELLVDYT